MKKSDGKISISGKKVTIQIDTKKKKKRHISSAEQGDGDFDSRLSGKTLEARVRSQDGSDGVPETHIDYVPWHCTPRVQGFGKNYNKIDWSKG